MNMPITTIKARLKEGLEKRNLNQQELSEKTGIPKGSISHYVTGHVEPKNDRIYLIAQALNVSEAWLLGYDVPMNKERTEQPSTVKAVKIPIVGTVVAGMPIDAYEEVIGYEGITAKMASTGDFFCLKIKGESMQPVLTEGDLVIVRQQSDVDSGDIAAVLVNGNEATVKQVHKSEGGITLVAYNSSVYQPKFYSNDDIEKLPITIVGKVVESRRSY